MIENPVLIRSIDNNNRLMNLLNMGSTLRRQEFPKYYQANGAIYINKIDSNLSLNTSFNDNEYPYIMDTKYDIDIDEPFDLKILELKLDALL